MRQTTAILTAAVLLMCSAAYGISYSVPGMEYEQDFDGLPTWNGTTPATAPNITITGRGPHPINGVLGTTGLADWTISNHAGSSSNTEFRVHDGSLAGSGGRGVLSLGTHGSTERALGVLATSNQISRFGVSFTNDTGITLTQFSLSYTGEQWRRGDVASPGNDITFAYSLDPLVNDINDAGFSDVPALSYSSPNSQAAPTEVALDGNLAMNQVLVMDMVSNIIWEPGDTLWLRWTGEDISGQDNGLAIDDMGFSAGTPEIPEPASLTLSAVAGLALLLVRRRLRK